jgi:gamma-glutamyl-gamma-aminobutyrate hydrolase PuuD
MANKKIYVVGPQLGYASWILPLGYTLTEKREEADLAMFTGGEDVDPSLYKEDKGAHTYISKARDEEEIKFFKYFYTRNVPMVGVCRGGQFLTVMSGGKLVQDSTHPSRHKITTFDGKQLEVTSSHHQQFLVEEAYSGLKAEIDYELLGWTEHMSYFHLDGKNKDYQFPQNYKEPEIVFYKETNALAIQSHPEWQELNHPTVVYLQNLITQLTNKTLCLTEKELV